jgi:signal transduction histidine kinase
LPVELHVTGRRAAPSVETAIYFTVAEALTNVTKPALATTAGVRVVASRDGMLVAEIADDGVGGAHLDGGSGPRGLADRLDALGGALSPQTMPADGTLVRASVPLRPHLERPVATAPGW